MDNLDFGNIAIGATIVAIFNLAIVILVKTETILKYIETRLSLKFLLKSKIYSLVKFQKECGCKNDQVVGCLPTFPPLFFA